MARCQPSPGWLALFDGGESEHACSLLRGETALSVLAVLHDDIQAWLADHPGEWDRESGCAARRLVQAVNNAARVIALDGDAGEAAGWVRLAWLEFVVAAAGPQIYHHLPREKAGRQRGAELAAQKRRERAAADPARKFIAAAHAALSSKGRTPGRPALIERAQQLAASAGASAEAITDHKVRRFLAGD